MRINEKIVEIKGLIKDDGGGKMGLVRGLRKTKDV